ncbi:substrate-binding domain-containing protein [Saccharothrix sp. NRRL B-16314]|uniref:substrate-binding domain-containing protein n=1 Tax=Saccharothrix sp. NRRL B-16314 TaxID=1463825 RepID=UPI000691535F|nr:substrate-binding domain-containing protein [Saccharothrix sp. NRRL B-16314]
MGTQPPLHRTVVVVDVAAFGRRHLVPQEEIRRGLYAALESAFEGCGLDWSAAHHEDRGDGVFVLMPPDAPKSRVAGGLRHNLLGELLRYNATRNDDAKFQLRMAITAGEVVHDEHGVVGDEVTLAFRLLDAKPLRDALAGSDALLALIVSDRFYDDVIRPDPAMKPKSFRQVDVDVKEVHGHAWVHVSDAGPPPTANPPPAAPADPGLPPADPGGKRAKPRLATVLLAVPLLFVAVTNGAGAAPPTVPPCPPPVQLNVLVSAEKEVVVRRLALGLERDLRRDNPLGCKELNTLVFTGTSAQAAAEALGGGWQPGDLVKVGAEPHVWLPDTTAEVQAVEKALRHRDDVRLHRRAGVAVSPLVLGASEESVGRIAEPDRDFDWRDVRWPAEVDTSSGVGMLAATGLVLHELGGLDLDAPDVPRELHEITGRMTADRPCAGDVTLIGSEKAVAGTPGCRVLYPRDGALVLDHPFVEVERTNRKSERRQRIMDRFLAHLLSAPAQEEFRREGFRDVAWNVGSQPDVRSGRPKTLQVEPDATAVRAAWEAASRRRVIAVAVDGSADARVFADEVRRLTGPRDELISLPLSAGVVEEGVERGADVVVLASAAPITPIAHGVSGPIRVVAVGLTDGACAPSTALWAAATAHGGLCHEIGGGNGNGAAGGQERALDDIARVAWGRVM